MSNDKKQLIRMAVLSTLLAAILIGGWAFLYSAGLAEEAEEEYAPLYVTANTLNGRYHPNKRSPIEAEFYYADELKTTGRISKDREWIEVYGGESGTVWVCIKYVTERYAPFTVTNENNGKVKIRSLHGGGKLKGYVQHGKSIEIDRVVLGWGHTKKGWVDLEYFIEEVEHN